MNESQFCDAADVDGSPSSGAVGAEDGSPFWGAADAMGESPFCGAVGVADESPSCGAAVDVVGGSPSCDAADEAPVCCGWCGTALTGADVAADGTDRWESP